MQQIEQGVRRQLHAQRRQPGGAPLALECREPQLGISKTRIERESGDQREPKPVGRQEVHETRHPQREKVGIGPGLGDVLHHGLVPLLASQGHLRHQHGWIGDGREDGAQNQLQGQRDPQGPPLNAQRGPKRHQQDRQQHQVLQEACIPGGEQRDIGHARYTDAHAVRVQNVRQGHIHPKQAGNGQKLPQGKAPGKAPGRRFRQSQSDHGCKPSAT